MSSAISTSKGLPPEGGSYKRKARHPQSREDRSFRLQAEESGDVDNSFQAWHFFVLMSLIGATVAVVLSRQSTPEHLILISLAIGAAGYAAFAFYRTLVPLTYTEVELLNEPLSERLRADLEREKALTLRSIKELEFDRAMGKVSQVDCDEMAARLRARAIGIMKQLDEDGAGYRALIEREVASRLGASVARGVDVAPSRNQPPSPAVPAAAEVPAIVERSCGCGAVNDADARFCKSCGSKLEVA